MKTAKPILHARDHMPGGADPLLPSPYAKGLAGKILDSLPDAFWPLDEAGGTTAHDITGNGYDMEPPSVSAAGPYSPPQWAQDTTPYGAPAPSFYNDGPGSLSYREGLANFDVPVLTDDLTLLIWARKPNPEGGGGGGGYYLIGQGQQTIGTSVPNGTGVQLYWGADGSEDGRVTLTASGVDTIYGHLYLLTDPGWHMIAATRAGTLWTLYIDGTPRVTTDDGGGFNPDAGAGSGHTSRTWIGLSGSFPVANYLSFGGVWHRALTPAEIADFYGDSTSIPGATPGVVLGTDGSGNPTWVPPGVTGGGGGGDPGDDPSTHPPPPDPFYGPVDEHGWHMFVHEEVAVLYDANPGRFDVPPRKWTRVPFNTVRLYRSWEPTPGSTVINSKLFPDERGLTPQAKNGMIHLAPGMGYVSSETRTSAQFLEGWVSPEYPILNYGMLPDDDPEVPGGGPRPDPPVDTTGPIAFDSYVRAFRFFDASHGKVMRSSDWRFPPEGKWRHFNQWEFFNVADGKAETVDWDVDNPFPIYPNNWPGRPMNMPPPYPKMSPTESLSYYLDSVGNPGWRGLGMSFIWEPGCNFCVHVWQDSPWTLQFTTGLWGGKVTQWNTILPTWKRLPFLALSYCYDPQTIDHTTGRLKT